MEERRAQLTFQLANALSQRGGSERHGAGGGAEVEEAGGLGEAVQALQRR